jgi:acylphosphatase
MASVRFLVSGVVQGVFFRASTAQRAHELGISGFARNLPDGRVEVVASGNEQALAELQNWLHQGPPSARVEAVERTELPAQEHVGFRAR